MFKMLKKIGLKCAEVAKSKLAAVSAFAFAFLCASSAFSEELVTESAEGVITVNPDSLVTPVRTAMVDTVTSASTLFIIGFAVVAVIFFIKRFWRG